MYAADGAAALVRSTLQSLREEEALIDSFEWSERNVLVVDNWNVLHGRGPQPLNEGERVLERVYIADSGENKL